MRGRTRLWAWHTGGALALTGFVLPAVSGSAAAEREESGGRFEGVRSFIRRRLAETQVPSLAVAVVQGGRTAWEEGFGWADRERRIPATPHTAYSLASVTKPITATALMVLEERDRVELDRPINDYLGDAPLRARVGDARQATVRRVANHTAGLPLHFQFYFADEPYPRPSMAETIRRYGNLVTAPGEAFTYSNLGYGVLSYLIERVSGQSYREFLQEEVFRPLGMKDASVGIDPRHQGRTAARYGPDGHPLPYYTTDHPGASEVYASAHDLARFGMLHVKAHPPGAKVVLSDAALDAMHRPAGAAPPDSLYSLGWFLGKTRAGQDTLAHGGGMDGVSTRLYLVPAEQVVIAVLANADTELPGEVFREIIPVLFGDEARDRPAAPAAPGSPAPAAIPGFQPPAELAGRWSGAIHTYQGDVPLTLEMPATGEVRARTGDDPESEVKGARFEEGLLTGELWGSVGTEDAGRLPYRLRLSLRLRPGGVLNGAVTARSTVARRLGNALSYWTELRHEEVSMARAASHTGQVVGWAETGKRGRRVRRGFLLTPR